MAVTIGEKRKACVLGFLPSVVYDDVVIIFIHHQIVERLN